MKKILTIALLVLLTAGLFVSCDADAIEKLFPEEISPVPETYTVTFDLNGATGGTAPDTQTISSGEKVAKPGDPTFDNHIFSGWYKTKDQITGELSDKWDFATDTATENTTLFARWVDTTISGLLSTTDFPEDTIKASTPTTPSDAWTNGADVSAFTYKDLALVLKKNSSGYMYAVLTAGVTFDTTNNCYTATISLGKLKFYMEDGVLTSFEYTGNNTALGYDGTYDAE